MPARVLIYCRKAVPHLSVGLLRSEIDQADLMTLAECLNLPEGETAAVRAMRPHLRVEGPNASSEDASQSDFQYAEVHFKPEGRPLQIWRRDARESGVGEVLDSLAGESSAGAVRVREHLAATREVVEIQMGVDDSLHLGATLAEVLAFRIAEEGDGLVWFYRRDFASPDHRGRTIHTTG